jgi:putative transposase
VLLYGEVFYTLRDTQILIELWRHRRKTVRPHTQRLGAFGYRPSAPESMMPMDLTNHASTFKLDHPMGALQ